MKFDCPLCGLTLRDMEEMNLVVLVRQHFEEKHPCYTPIETVQPRITDTEIVGSMQEG